ncbi:glycosyl hydrolase [Pedobacter sp. HDW13]|uniref:glycoside hydrolase family 3 N-terminal domain-containing protein n=1 Tax=Pedobacter sp. HDW13 TaxID=2714940 RepID=UPI001408A9C5|nr:glycoside hydrolase family 3 N-terminal domain-containing protein [Pedobacter sp. HDW13]QIL38350.1 glycosyl hydrolase [Pedobacter sp. HDW13]
MKSYCIAFFAIVCSLNAFSQKPAIPLYKRPELSPRERVKDLLPRLSLKEKLSQMQHIQSGQYEVDQRPNLQKLFNFSKGISYGCLEGFPYSSDQYTKLIYHTQKYMREESRFGIPVIPVMEGLHGAVQDGSTIYPQSIAIASTFNTQLTYQMAGFIGAEAKAMGVKQVLAPDLDLARELRWGRVEETYGEDPFLVSQMGIAYIQGLNLHKIISTPKHFIGHGSPLGGLNLASVEGGKRQLFSLYMQPFEAVIKALSPLSIMNCYSAYDGEPVTGSAYFLTDLLRKRLKFQGYVYSDWGSIEMLSSFHKTAVNQTDAAMQAIKAGLDLEASGEDYAKLESLVKNKQFAAKYIDAAAAHVLYTKFASGLFEDQPVDTLNYKKSIHTPQSVQLSRQIANESAVLLKNANGILPLDASKLKSIAVIGPNADQVQFGDYSWTRNNKDGITPLQGIRAFVKNSVEINYAKGCDLTSRDKGGFNEAVLAASKSDLAIVFVGSQSASLSREYLNSTSGEGFDLSDLNIPGVQEDLVKAVKATGKPVVTVIVSGRPFAIGWFKEYVEGIIMQWYAGEQQGNAIADILFGKVNPSGKLAVSFPQSAGHLPAYYNYLPSDKGYYKRSGTVDKPGRDYVFSSPDALYPFGFGLSYTNFKYENLKVNKLNFKDADTIVVSADVINVGKCDGQEVPQLYIRDVVSSVSTPVKQLKAFEKIHLKAGEQRTVNFKVPVIDLALYNTDYIKVVEPGEFKLMVGSSSQDIKLQQSVFVNPANMVRQENITHSGGQRNGEINPEGRKISVSGVIRDVQSTVVAEAIIKVKNQLTSVLSDKDGKYVIEAKIGDTLIFSARNFKTKEVLVNGEKNVNVTLVPGG